MKKKILKILIFGVMFLSLLTGCTNQKVNSEYSNEKNIEEEIITNLEKIAHVTDLNSSNPFDYTKNEYYTNIVNLGNDAVIVLEKMYKQGEITGVNAYLSALAIQDITNCNLYKEYNLDWSTAKEFYDLWENHNCSFKK